MCFDIGGYSVAFENGGIEVSKGGKTLYFNKRPVFASVKDYGAICRFRDLPYGSVRKTDEGIEAEGRFLSDNGSVLLFRDLWTASGTDLKVDRKVTVEKADEKDLGFSTKVSFYHAGERRPEEFDYFYPGQWYRQNEYAADYAMGKDLSLQYIRRKETYAGLPLFSMMDRKTGETVTLSRWAADATLPSLDRTATENYAYVDPKMTVGSFGISSARPEAQVYTYYGHRMSVPLPETQCDGLAADYVYPAENGQQPAGKHGPWTVDQPLSNITWVHPMREGFAQHYAVAVNFERYTDFGTMLKCTWRHVYDRLKDRLFDVDNGLLYLNMMRFLKDVTKNFGNTWGTPFVAQLPDFDPNSFSAEIGFVGQQTGIGYQLLRYGTLFNDPEAVQKGLGILNHWANDTMTETGCPKIWEHLSAHQFEPQPFWIREIGDGMEGILDAWRFEKQRGRDHDNWLNCCVSTADWIVERMNEDGSLFRAYAYDNRPCLDSKASTPCVIRFLLWMYKAAAEEKYLNAAVRAGEWTWTHMYKGFEYRGGTCDQSDVMDKESGLYAMFAFDALYECTGEAKWLEAACGAADYTETFTFVWNFPVRMPYPNHPFVRNHITGQSNVTVGTGGGDVYMAACGYEYYRLYLLSGDEHYADVAEFVHLNSKQANDIDGSCGYRYIGLVNEGGAFSEQEYRGRYHWLPWCTFVEVDPSARFFDTFGCYDVADVRKIPPEKQREMLKNMW
ncbi:MAG: hypothetical protein Q4G19_01990 [Clostridia bacterium]|nr:hypothetical protein [Clostridia bacterium]